MPDPRPVVVGVDGSPASLAAVGYAARVAERRGAPLHLIHAYQYPLSGLTRFDRTFPGEDAALRERRLALREIADRVRIEHPELSSVVTEQVNGPAVGVLIELSRADDITVLGTRGHGGFTGLLLGSVAAQVAAHARGPVILVPPEAADRADGPVAVGFDGSPGAVLALRFAAGEAGLRRSRLAVTRLYDPVIDRDGDYAAQSLAEAAKILAEEYPDLDADVESLPSENIALGLVEISELAGLTVVGSRGHGGFAGLLLGSVGRSLAHHARGPVAVVHPIDEEGDSS